MAIAAQENKQPINPQPNINGGHFKTVGCENETFYPSSLTDERASAQLHQALLAFYLAEGEEDLKVAGDAESAMSFDLSSQTAPETLLNTRLTANERGLRDLLQSIRNISPSMGLAVRTFEEFLRRCRSREDLLNYLREKAMYRALETRHRVMVASANGSAQPAYQILKTEEPHADRPAGHARSKKPKSLDETMDPSISGTQPTD